MPGSDGASSRVEAYIRRFPEEVQVVLRKVRRTIKKAAPTADEAISYGIPAYRLHGRSLIYFAAYKKHIGVYPVPGGEAAFVKQLNAYRSGRGTLQFPLGGPIPYALIVKVVKARIRDEAAKAKRKKQAVRSR